MCNVLIRICNKNSYLLPPSVHNKVYTFCLKVTNFFKPLPPFHRDDWMNIGFCYPKGTTFSIISDLHNRLTKETRKTGMFVKTAQREKISHTHQARGYYYWEEDTG